MRPPSKTLTDQELEIMKIVWVRQTATVRDVNYYDGSKPDTTVEIEGRFAFDDMDEWICAEPAAAPDLINPSSAPHPKCPS